MRVPHLQLSLVSAQVGLMKTIMSLSFGLAIKLLSPKVSAPGGSQDEQLGPGRVVFAVPWPQSKVWLLSLVVRNPPGKRIFSPARSSFFQLTMSC